MSFEIERKFLVEGDFKDEVFDSFRICQGYLNSSAERVVRVRVKGDKAFLTVKGLSDETGLSRFEWEKEISVEDALSLLKLAEPGSIEKTRHLISNTDGKHTWEVDEFQGDNKGLIIAEIEIEDPNDTFDKPHWLGKEVTGDKKYYNSELSKNPYCKWK